MKIIYFLKQDNLMSKTIIYIFLIIELYRITKMFIVEIFYFSKIKSITSLELLDNS